MTFLLTDTMRSAGWVAAAERLPLDGEIVDVYSVRWGVERARFRRDNNAQHSWWKHPMHQPIANVQAWRRCEVVYTEFGR